MPRNNLKDHINPGRKYKYAQLTVWNALNPNALFGRHENHDDAIVSSSSPTLCVPRDSPTNKYPYLYAITPLYNASAVQGNIHAGPACWQQAQKNFQANYSKKLINQTIKGAGAFNVQHPLASAGMDGCCNSEQKLYYWHIHALPPIVPLRPIF
jgi:hypothetical protein